MPDIMAKIWLLAGVAVVIIIIAVVAILLTQQAAPTPAEKIPIKIGTIFAYYETAIPLLVADALGYFEEAGLDVQLLGFPGGSEVRKAVVAGEVDFGAHSAVHVGIAQNAGADMVIVMTLHEAHTIDICARPGIESIEDLRGKVVGVTAEGSLSWASAISYLKRAGLEPDRDVKIIGIGSDPQVIVAALKGGRIDAYACWTNIVLTLTKLGIAKPLLGIMTDPKTHEKFMGAPRIVENVITSMRNEAKREAAIRLKKALKRALDFIAKSSPEEIANVVLKSRFTRDIIGEVSREDLVDAIKLLKPAFSIDGAVYRDGWVHGTYMALLQPALPQQFKPIPFERVVWEGVTEVR